MLTGKLFIICGLSRLSARLARSLLAQNATVKVVMYVGDKESLAQSLPPDAEIIRAAEENAGEVLQSAGVTQASCVLAVAEQDLVNLRSTVCSHNVAPEVPVVIRTFDPKLADQFEQGLNVRRAFSVSALAAPAFAAAACGATAIEGLRLGEEVVPINMVTISEASHLCGSTLGHLRTVWKVNLVARRRNGGEWVLGGDCDDAGIVGPGDILVISGASKQCMKLLAFSAGWHLRQSGRSRGQRGATSGPRKKNRRESETWLPRVALALVILMATSIAVFQQMLHLRTIDAIYFVVATLTTTGYGDISVMKAPDWVKLFDCIIMLSGGALIGIMFSYLATIATAERIDIVMGRRAANMTNHIVIVGLGNVGYRVCVALTDLGLDAVVVDVAPQARFFESVRERAPVLTGDARLPETLDRTSIRDAAAIICCTSDDLVNVEACLHAKRMNSTIHTVARVYDDQMVGALSSAFNIDTVLSATHIAESSFFMASTDVSALRPLELDGLSLVAGRYRPSAPITIEHVDHWRSQGVQTLAFRTDSGPVQSYFVAGAVEAIILGSEKAVRDVLNSVAA